MKRWIRYTGIFPRVRQSPVLKEPRRAWVIASDDVVLESTLSAGAFGQVWKGQWQGLEVAVKRMHQSLLELDSFVSAKRSPLVC